MRRVGGRISSSGKGRWWVGEWLVVGRVVVDVVDLEKEKKVGFSKVRVKES